MINAKKRELIDDGWEESIAQKYLDYCSRKSHKASLQRLGKTTVSDSQINKFYNSEFEWSAELDDQEFGSFEEVQQFVDDLIQQPVWKKINRTRTKKIRVRETKRHVAGCAEPGFMWLNPKYDGFKLYTVLHELCHCAGYLDHDIGFRQSLLQMIEYHYPWSQVVRWKKIMAKNKLKLKFSSVKVKPIEEWYTTYQRAAKMRKSLSQ